MLESLVPAHPVLGLIVLEIRYAFGHTYLDRCGQTLVDIERAMPDWVPGPTTVQSGSVQHVSGSRVVVFNNETFNFTASGALQMSDAADQAERLWKIVRTNLGLTDFIRIGCRTNHFLAKESPELSDKATLLGKLSCNVPSIIAEKGYAPIRSESSVTVAKNGLEFRVTVSPILRTDGANPSVLTRVNPRLLHVGRREAQKKAINERIVYNKDPSFAVALDVDCAAYDPPAVKPRDFMLNQHEIVKSDFLTLLDGI